MTADAFLAAVEARAAAATPGEWIYYQMGDGGPTYLTKTYCDKGSPDKCADDCGQTLAKWGECDDDYPPDDADLTFIAATRTDLPRLLAFARAVLALCDERENNGGRLVRIEPIRDLADQHLRGTV